MTMRVNEWGSKIDLHCHLHWTWFTMIMRRIQSLSASDSAPAESEPAAVSRTEPQSQCAPNCWSFNSKSELGYASRVASRGLLSQVSHLEPSSWFPWQGPWYYIIWYIIWYKSRLYDIIQHTMIIVFYLIMMMISYIHFMWNVHAYIAF
jgi:hypothetical protein